MSKKSMELGNALFAWILGNIDYLRSASDGDIDSQYDAVEYITQEIDRFNKINETHINRKDFKCKEIGTPSTIGELRKLIEQYPDDTVFGFRNQPIQSLYEVCYCDESDEVYVLFQ